MAASRAAQEDVVKPGGQSNSRKSMLPSSSMAIRKSRRALVCTACRSSGFPMMAATSSRYSAGVLGSRRKSSLTSCTLSSQRGSPSPSSRSRTVMTSSRLVWGSRNREAFRCPSQSTTTTFFPWSRARMSARLMAVTVLPTPPLLFMIAIVLTFKSSSAVQRFAVPVLFSVQVGPLLRFLRHSTHAGLKVLVSGQKDRSILPVLPCRFFARMISVRSGCAPSRL